MRVKYESLLKIIIFIFLCGNLPVYAGELLDAAEDDNYERVKELLIYDFDNVNEVGAFGRTALFHAVKNNNRNMVCALLKYGSDVNLGEERDDLPIFIAVEGDKYILSMLIKEGVDVNVKNFFGKTPLHLSVKFSSGGEDVMKMLISAGADTEARDNFGRTPLMEAVLDRNYGQVVLLVEAGAHINVKDGSGKKLSTIARKNIKIFNYLKKYANKK